MYVERQPEALLHTFVDGTTLLLRVIWQGQVWQWALTPSESATLAAAIDTWRQAVRATEDTP